MDALSLADEVQGTIRSLGRAFIFASYLPSLLFVALNQYAVIPALRALDRLDSEMSELPGFLGELAITLLLSLLLAVLLVSLNSALIKLFEGFLPRRLQFLLRPWQERNEREAARMYGELGRWRGCYLEFSSIIAGREATGEEEQAADPNTSAEEAAVCFNVVDEQIATQSSGAFDCGALVADVAQTTSLEALYECRHRVAVKMQRIHDDLFRDQPVQMLPYAPESARPTALGNAFAVFEEYPLDHYGMDGVVLWPRLRQYVDAKLLQSVDNQKMYLDFQLNMATLAVAFSAEAAGVGIAERKVGWFIVAAAALVLGRLAYLAAVRISRTMGELVSTCFDLYRGELLKQFGLTQPAGFLEEYLTWMRLSSFLQSGELFHWPGDL